MFCSSMYKIVGYLMFMIFPAGPSDRAKSREWSLDVFGFPQREIFGHEGDTKEVLQAKRRTLTLEVQS